MAINPGYFIGEACSSFRRNWVMSLVAVTIVYVSLLLVGRVRSSPERCSRRSSSSFEQKVSIQIFLKDGAAPADVEALQTEHPQGRQASTSVTYVSKAQALERFKQRTKNAPQLVEQLRGNPLPASLEIKLVDPREVKVVVASIKKEPALAKVLKNPNDPEKDLKYGQEVIDNLFAATSVIRMFIIVFVMRAAARQPRADRQHHPARDLLAAQGDRHHAPRRRVQLVHPHAVPHGGRVPVAHRRAACCASPCSPRSRSSCRGCSGTCAFLPVSVSGGTIAQLFVLVIVSGVLMGLLGSGIAVRRYLKV